MSAPPALPGLLASLAPTLDHYGYLAVGGLVFLEDFGIPVPGETILIAAAVYAGAGRLNVVAVALIGFVAAVLGDNVGFAIGHFGGTRLIRRFGRYVGLNAERVDKAESFFRRHGGKVVVVARFIEGLRQANGIIAGAIEMPWLEFVGFNAIGAALWVGLWVAVGDLAGSHIDAIYSAVSRYALIALAVAVVLLVARFVLRRRRRHRGAPASTGDDRGPQPPTAVAGAAGTSGPDRLGARPGPDAPREEGSPAGSGPAAPGPAVTGRTGQSPGDLG